MSTFVLLPGAGSTSWYWHRVEPLLRDLGHHTIAVDLPSDDDSATFETYADVTIAAIGDRATTDDDLVLVAQSLAGFTAPLVAARVPVRMIVLVAAMVPTPGESAGDWWTTTGAEQARIDLADAEGRDPDDIESLFLHDVPADVAAEGESQVHEQSGTPFAAPFPLRSWPDVLTHFLLCRDDRFFPADFQRRIVTDRLGIVPDEMDGGHLPALAHPEELTRRLEEYVR